MFFQVDPFYFTASCLDVGRSSACKFMLIVPLDRKRLLPGFPKYASQIWRSNHVRAHLRKPPKLFCGNALGQWTFARVWWVDWEGGGNCCSARPLLPHVIFVTKRIFNCKGFTLIHLYICFQFGEGTGGCKQTWTLSHVTQVYCVLLSTNHVSRSTWWQVMQHLLQVKLAHPRISLYWIRNVFSGNLVQINLWYFLLGHPLDFCQFFCPVLGTSLKVTSCHQTHLVASCAWVGGHN